MEARTRTKTTMNGVACYAELSISRIASTNCMHRVCMDPLARTRLNETCGFLQQVKSMALVVTLLLLQTAGCSFAALSFVAVE